MNFNLPFYFAFFLLFAINFANCSTIVQHNPLKPHHQTSQNSLNSVVNCTNSTSCGANAFCNPKTQICQCNLGFQKTSANSSCSLVNCNSSTFCQMTQNLSTKCFQNRCVCDDSFRLDIKTQTCFPISQPLGAWCHSDLDCGFGAVCGTSSENSQPNFKSCICRFGYLPSSSNSVNCELFRCSTDHDCSSISTISGQTFCNEGGCYCNYALGWSLATGNQSCVNNRNPLNGKCVFDSDCGRGAVCGRGNQCQCQLGYLPNISGGNIDCHQYTCSSDLDCSLHFSGIPHLTCQSGSCQCDSSNGWTLLPTNQSCKARSVLIGGSCLFDSDCGLNADCVNGNCKCHFGDVVQSNGMDCSYKTCYSDSDCSSIDPNAVCNWNSCVCESGYLQNFISQSCVSDDPNLGGIMAVIGLIMLGVFLLVCGVIVLIWAVSRGGTSRRRAAFIQKS